MFIFYVLLRTCRHALYDSRINLYNTNNTEKLNMTAIMLVPEMGSYGTCIANEPSHPKKKNKTRAANELAVFSVHLETLVGGGGTGY